MHIAVATDSTIAYTYRNGISVHSDSVSNLPAPTCYTLLKATFREVQMYSLLRTAGCIAQEYKYMSVRYVVTELNVYFPLDETSRSTLGPRVRFLHRYTSTFTYVSDEDLMLTLCESSAAYQSLVTYDNWWYCDQPLYALQLATSDFTLPLPDVSMLPSSTEYYLVDFWVHIGALHLSTTLVSFGPFTISTAVASGLQLVLTTSAPAASTTNFGSPSVSLIWSYVKLWVKQGEIRVSLDNSAPVFLFIFIF